MASWLSLKLKIPLSPRGLSVRGGAGLLAQVLGISGLQALYDPSDLTSLYQSRTGGSTGAVDSVVGIMLDKHSMGGKTAANFIAGQSELAVNGDFSSGATGWTVSGNDGTHIATFSGGTLRFQSDTTSPTLLVNNSFSMTAGAWYQITTVCSAWTSGTVKENNTNVAMASGVGTTVVVAKALYSDFAGLTRSGTNVDLTIDSISIKLIPGYHALAPSDAARPILRAGYVDTDGVDDWMQIFPTLNLGEQWWHVGGWQSNTSGKHSFATSNAGTNRASLRNASGAWSWRSSADASVAIATGNCAVANVATLEQASTSSISGRYNGGGDLTITPYDDSASTQGLALFSGNNASYDAGIAGRFYGGAFGTGTLTSTDRALLERYVAGLTGVAL